MRSIRTGVRRTVRNRGLAALLALGAAAALPGCNSLDVTNPNQEGSDNFWTTEAAAQAGLIAAYNATEFLGTFARWQAFANDIRSDIGTARTSPWGELASFNRFQLTDYNFEINRELYAHNYELIKRANEVIARTPAIPDAAFSSAAAKAQIVAEAKFLRSLAYYNLVTLYENVPLVTSPLAPTERPGNATGQAIFTQIEQDLTEASAALPAALAANQAGRPTKWAALAILGRARLQRAGVYNEPAKWAEASAALTQVIGSNSFSLLPNYADNFNISTDNQIPSAALKPESVFEVQMEDMFPIGVTGVSFPKMIGPCYRGANRPAYPDYNPTFCDGRPTRWYFDEFAKSRTSTGGIDPRMEATLLWNHTSGESIYGRPYSYFFFDDTATAGVREDTMIFFRKYGETYLNQEQRWDNPINYKVIRYADVLLMQAEALNEQNQTAQAYQFINQVRTRARKNGVPAGLSQAQMRDTILYERMFEFGLEASRFNDLRRQDQLTAALSAHDPDFGGGAFVAGKSERLPIPNFETNGNPNVRQNPGW